MSFTDDLRRAAIEPVPDLADLLVTAAWRIDCLVQRLAVALGQPEGAVRLSEGLGGHTDTRQTGPNAPGAVSGAVVADFARIAPRPEPEQPGVVHDRRLARQGRRTPRHVRGGRMTAVEPAITPHVDIAVTIGTRHTPEVCRNKDAHPSGHQATYSGPKTDPQIWGKWLATHSAHGFVPREDR